MGTKLNGYTSLMSPEGMKLPYLEALLSWAPVCDNIGICYSRFPQMKLKVPEGAVTPWDDDGSLEVLKQFDKDMLGGDKLVITEHAWDITEPREDGRTKQLAREAIFEHNPDQAMLVQFDSDELLRESDIFKLLERIELETNGTHASPLLLTGILEFFGSANQVRFGFGNWYKIRFTRNTLELCHDMPIWARGRHPKTGKIIGVDNKDDGAGIISRFSLNRPPIHPSFWLSDVRVLQAQQAAAEGKIDYDHVAQILQQDLDLGIWLYHTSWMDIARKWSMGWFFDNFWSVLNGKQETFTQKAEFTGEFTATRAPVGDQLEAELARELDRPTIKSIDVEVPEVFAKVKEWRERVGLDVSITV